MTSRFCVTTCTLLGALVLVGCAPEPPPAKEIIRPVVAIKVTDAAQFRQRWFPGRAQGTQEVDLSFRVSGPLITLPVKVGDEVSKGDVVARIDPRDFEVALRNVQGQLESARASYERAKSDYERLVRINEVDPGATSQAALDRARAQRNSALANVRSLEASVAGAKDQVEYSSLKAPFDGTVVNTYVENFEDVQAKQPIVRLVDDSRIEMVVNVPENLISLTPYVKDVVVKFDPFPDVEVPAEIKEVGTEASETTRTYPVTLVMDQPENVKILPGMAGQAAGEAELPDATGLAAMEIPVSAVYSGENGKSTRVWVIDEASGTVSSREVQVQRLADHGLRVSAGLEPGELIATAGVHYLTEGQKVRVISREGD